jgi:hypothetical protein
MTLGMVLTGRLERPHGRGLGGIELVAQSSHPPHALGLLLGRGPDEGGLVDQIEVAFQVVQQVDVHELLGGPVCGPLSCFGNLVGVIEIGRLSPP